MLRSKSGKAEKGVKRAADPLQQLIVQGMHSSNGKKYLEALFRGELSGKTQQNVKEIALICLIDILDNMKEVGVSRAMEMYSGMKPPSPSVLRLTAKGERDVVQLLADLIPGDEEEAEKLLASLVPSMDSITWGKLVEFSLLVQEYNLEWALAAYDWSEERSWTKDPLQGETLWVKSDSSLALTA